MKLIFFFPCKRSFMWQSLVSTLFDVHRSESKLHNFFFAFCESIFHPCFTAFSVNKKIAKIWPLQIAEIEKDSLHNLGNDSYTETILFFWGQNCPNLAPFWSQKLTRTVEITLKWFQIQLLTFLKIFILRSKLPKFGPLLITEIIKDRRNYSKMISDSIANFFENFHSEVEIAQIWPSPGSTLESKA